MVGWPSLVVADLELRERPSSSNDLDALYRRLLATGHLRGVFDFALERLALAETASRFPAESRFVTLLHELASRASAARDLVPIGHA